MRKDKIRAYELRRKGKSYSEIRKVLGVSKGTLSGWFKGQEWSEEIKEKLSQEQSIKAPKKRAQIIKANKERWSRWRSEHRTQAIEEFKTLKSNQLFVAGLMMYWGEGDRNTQNSQVRLATTDPAKVRLLYKLFKNVLGIAQEKIGIYLILYPDLKEEMQKTFWSRAVGIPLFQFKKSIYIKSKNPTKRTSYGVCNIFVNSRELKEKILTWINLLSEELV
jgi:hypothetical protein